MPPRNSGAYGVYRRAGRRYASYIKTAPFVIGDDGACCFFSFFVFFSSNNLFGELCCPVMNGAESRSGCLIMLCEIFFSFCN